MSTSPLVDFKKNVAGQKVKGRGIPIGNYLIVSYAFGSESTFQIFRAHDGKLFIDTIFINLEDCVEMARWFDETFRDYMDIWKSDPDADIISLAKWSVANGIKIYELVAEIKHKHVNKTLISRSWEIAETKKNKWLRMF